LFGPSSVHENPNALDRRFSKPRGVPNSFCGAEIAKTITPKIQSAESVINVIADSVKYHENEKTADYTQCTVAARQSNYYLIAQQKLNKLEICH